MSVPYPSGIVPILGHAVRKLRVFASLVCRGRTGYKMWPTSFGDETPGLAILTRRSVGTPQFHGSSIRGVSPLVIGQPKPGSVKMSRPPFALGEAGYGRCRLALSGRPQLPSAILQVWDLGTQRDTSNSIVVLHSPLRPRPVA